MIDPFTLDPLAALTPIGTLGANNTVRGTLSAGGHDVYQVNLVAGQSYTFSLVGIGTNNLRDPLLKLYAADGTTMLAENDDGLPNENSRIVFTATTTGTYYLDVGAFAATDTGNYGLQFASGTRPAFDFDMGAGMVDSDRSWSTTPGTGATVTWSARRTGAATDASGATAPFSRFTAAEIAAVTQILQFYTDVCGLNFTRLDDGDGFNDSATMRFGNYMSTSDGSGAYAYYPGSAAADSVAGDVWANTQHVSTTSLPLGGYSYETLMHEIGHAVGLSHPGLYNAAPGVSITYANNAQFMQDSGQYTVMSYFGGSQTGARFGAQSYASGLLMLDVMALQAIYGANNTTRTGASSYGYNASAGVAYNFSQGATGYAIWDAGGTDTIDGSGSSSAQTINLQAGSFSSIGGGTNNVSIVPNVTIENAVGGSGSDKMYGNAVRNVMVGGGGNDTITGDGTVVWNAAAMQIRRLYLTTLGRFPDDGGWASWSNMLAGGTSLVNIAANFVNSAEFQLVYGALDNASFVTTLYNNALHRAPDAGGLAAWVNALNAGTSRAQVVIGFSDSAELKITSDIERQMGQVYRLYVSALGRGPDPSGFKHWVNLATGGMSLATVANEFVISAEFQQKYGALDNTAFVQLLYQNVLGRAADPAGLSSWVNQLNAGVSRAQVLQGFSDSAEHVAKTAIANSEFMQTVDPSWNDVIEGGLGSDTLSGGWGADTYIFRAGSGGTDTVQTWEAWDNLQLLGFGYANVAAAMTRMTQQGSDVLFSDQGQVLTLKDTVLSEVRIMVG